jgi:hypothetical protein
MERLFINYLLDVYIFTTSTTTLKQIYNVMKFHGNCSFGFHFVTLFVTELISLHFAPFMLTFYVTAV